MCKPGQAGRSNPKHIASTFVESSIKEACNKAMLLRYRAKPWRSKLADTQYCKVGFCRTYY